MRRTFTQIVSVAADPATVRERIAALRHDIVAHDRFAVVTTLSRIQHLDGCTVEDYLVRDRIGYRLVAWSFTYRTRIVLNENGKVTYDTAIGGRIRLSTRQWCEAAGDGALLFETVDVVAPPVVVWIVYRAVAAAQSAVLAQVKAASEGASPGTAHRRQR